MLNTGVFIIETVDLAGVYERLQVPVAYDLDHEYGGKGFDIGDYILPELYQSVACHFVWDR